MPSFDDMMSSARGPGVIGTVLALIVLVGFSGLFLLVFDENPKGSAGLSLAAVVKHHESEIETLHSNISIARKNAEAIPILEKQTTDIETITRSTRTNKGTVTGLQNRMASLRADIETARNNLLAYKAKYRAYMRDRAKGEKIDEITTLSGKTFKQVSVREVTPIGMQIRHADGFTRIPYEDLPLAMQERFQFDPQEKKDAVKAESSSEQDHFQKVADADAAQQIQASADRAKQNQEDKTKVLSQIASLEAQIKMFDSDLLDLQRQFVSAQAKAAAGKAAGHRVIDGSSSVQYAIQAKRNQRAEALNQIQLLRSKL